MTPAGAAAQARSAALERQDAEGVGVTRVVKGLKTAGWLKQEGKKYLVPAGEDV